MDAAPPPPPRVLDPPPRLRAWLYDPAALYLPRVDEAAVPEVSAATDFAAACVPCPACGTALEATRTHCFGCGWRLTTPDRAAELDTLRRGARAVYLLMGASLFVALPAVTALVLVYAHRSRARGTWLDGHYEWQVDTLWGVFWTGAAVLIATWLGDRFLGTGEWLLLAGLPALAWYAHRIAKGWTRLADGEPMTEW